MLKIQIQPPTTAKFESWHVVRAVNYRTWAYHPDLRWRMVYQRYVLAIPVKTVSSNLCVDQSTVRRTLRIFDNTGSVDKRTYSCSVSRKKMSTADQLHVLELAIENPGIYLTEMKKELHARGTDVDESTIICRSQVLI